MTSDQKMQELSPPLKFDLRGGLFYTLNAYLLKNILFVTIGQKLQLKVDLVPEFTLGP
jgi:hypothetical protein